MSRPPGILIPGGRPAGTQAFLDHAIQGRRTAKQPEPRRFVDSAGREMKRPAIQGFAALYQTTFRAQGRFVFLQEGCLIDSIYQPGKRLLIDHNESKQVGSSAFGLEFANTSAANPVHGLAFRMPLTKNNPDSELIYDTISKVERPCVSVGLDFEETEEVVAAGEKVLVVIKATLSEISLVPEGAVPGTNASLVDLDTEESWLLMAARQHSFIADKIISNVDARAKRIKDMLHDIRR